jgi:hypothetical protein
VENLTNKKIKTLRSDNGGEYTFKELVSFCKAVGIRRELIVPHNPQQNGVAESKNCSIEESVKAMMNDQNLSMFLWGEAAMTTIYIQNRSPHHLKNMTPEESLSERSQVQVSVKKKEWKEAMMEEYQSIMKNDVWEIVPRPKGKFVVTSKWVYKIKHAVDGSIDKYKARFVARGFSQQEGEDYDETFSPVSRYTSIRAIISLATSMGWSLHQMDVKTTFLNGVIEEEVWQKHGEIFLGKGKHILRYLRGTLNYGLRYASNSDVQLHGFTNSVWAGSADDRKSTSGICFSLGSAMISWASRKQNFVALSTAEAEYIAACDACTEAV